MRKSLVFTGALACLFAGTLAFGQEDKTSKVTHKPGDVLTFSVPFGGRYASQIANVRLLFQAQSAPPSDQNGLGADFGSGASTRLDDNTFNVSVTIPPNVFTGDYLLVRVDIGIKPPLSSTVIYTGSTLPNTIIQIDNPEHFERPVLKGVKEISKP